MPRSAPALPLRLSSVLAAALSLALPAHAARTPPDGPRIAADHEIAPSELAAGASQSVDVTLRNVNDAYGASGTKLLQVGDVFRIDFGPSCVTQVTSVPSI